MYFTFNLTIQFVVVYQLSKIQDMRSEHPTPKTMITMSSCSLPMDYDQIPEPSRLGNITLRISLSHCVSQHTQPTHHQYTIYNGLYFCLWAPKIKRVPSFFIQTNTFKLLMQVNKIDRHYL